MKPPFTQVVSSYINLVYHFARRWTHGRGGRSRDRCGTIRYQAGRVENRRATRGER